MSKPPAKRPKKAAAKRKSAAKKATGKKSRGKKATAKKSKRSAQSYGRVRRLLQWSTSEIFRFIFYWTCVVAVWGVIAVVGAIIWYAHDLPDVDTVAGSRQRASITLSTFDGRPFMTYGDVRGADLSIQEFPAHLRQAVIATEDRRFYSHYGLDPIGLARAVYVNLKTGRVVQGGSTITQQLAKNVYLSPDRTIKRKVQEVLLAFWLEQKFSKDEILALYLNRVYLGSGTYGVDAASRKYFSKPAGKLSIPEAAMLAGLLKAPSRYAPTRSLRTARKRANVVLANMVEAGYLNADQLAKARRNPAALRRQQIAGSQARYFADWVLAQIPDFVGQSDANLVVITTLDNRLQKLAEKAMADALEKNSKKFQVDQGALLAMSPNGAVRAMIGGKNYSSSQFNRATQAKRQPGSAFKPVIFLSALKAGIEPGDIFLDKPFRIKEWAPKNYSGRFRGKVSVADALAFSINTVAARITQKVGYNAVQDMAVNLGIASEVPRHPSIALGTNEVTLLELTTAYATMANGGNGAFAHGIVEIRDSDGKVLFRRKSGELVRLIDADQTAKMTAMLQRVISKGTGKRAKLDRPAAGKTGTTQNYRDALFLGYSADYVAGVWLGNDDNSAMKRVTGGGLPARIWARFMRNAHKGVPSHDFAKSTTGLKSFLDRLLGAFKSGTTATGSGTEKSNSSDDYQSQPNR